MGRPGARDPRNAFHRSDEGGVRSWMPLLFIAAGALALRLVFLIQLRSTPFFSNFFSDSLLYLNAARSILDGSVEPKAFFLSPLYPYIIAAVMRIAGSADLPLRLLQCMLGSLTVAGAYLLAKELFSRNAAIMTALVAAVYAPLVYYDNAVLIEPWVTACAIFHMIFLAKALRGGLVRHAAMAGVLFGLLCVFRANTLLFAFPFAALAITRRKKLPAGRFIAVYLAACMVAILPWTIRNAVVEGVFAPVTASGGFNFYAGNNPATEGLYRIPENVDPAADPNGERFAEAETGRDLTSSEVSTFWFSRSMRWIKDDPIRYMSLLGRKILLFFHPSEIEQLGLGMAFFRDRYPTVLDLLPVCFPVLLLFSILGFTFAVRNRVDIAAPASFLAAYAIATALFFVNGRLRLPVIPIMIAVAAYGAEQLWIAARLRNRTAFLAAVPVSVIAAGLIAFVQPSYSPTFEEEFNRLGQIAFDGGDFVQAQAHFERSMREKEQTRTVVNLANALAAQGKAEAARPLYERAIARDPSQYLAYFNLGNLCIQQNDASSAVRFWMKAVSVREDFAPAHRNLGLLLLRLGDAKDALMHLRRYRECEPDAVKRREVQREIDFLETKGGLPSR
jgi:4-amino-4-deoxy-L-arabinose transferase-like glycosyltransferase